MAATFPGGVKTFAVVNPGDPILSSTENAQQDEIKAIEIELLKSSGSVVDHDALTNFVPNEHIDHSAISITVGTGLNGGGDLTASRTIMLSHLGLQNLTGPGADRVMFWDQSAGMLKWLTVSTGLAITDTSLAFSHLGLQNLTSPGEDRVLFWDQSAGMFKWLTLGTGLTINDTTIEFSDSTVLQNLIYIQLFGKDEIIETESAKAYLFVPSYLSGKKIKKMGIGIVTAGTSNTTVALDTYASVSGNGYTEGSDISVSLPSAGTKIPINVTAGSGSPKGLDCWFVMSK